jgi:putative DNA primase/helicase
MTGAGAVIGRKILLRPQLEDDWAVVTNQWGLCIGRPGIMKSPAMDEALRPIKQLTAAAAQNFNKDQASHAVAAMAAKLRRDENLRAAAKIIKANPEADVSYLLEETEEAEPTLRRYIANDTTVESLGVLLQQNPNGLLVFRDELVSLLDSLDQEDHVSQRGFYLTAAERMRLHRKRRRRGMHSLRTSLHVTQIDGLIRKGLLKQEERSHQNALQRAIDALIGTVLDDTDDV